MQISIFDDIPLYKINEPVRLIELFAGIGSQAKAFELLSRFYNIEFEHYKAIEYNTKVIDSYNAIHGTTFTSMDITKVTAKDLDIVDTNKYTYIMTYSFPCQDLSTAGLGKGMRKGDNTRSGLLWEVERLLQECKLADTLGIPQVLVMENVPEIRSKQPIYYVLIVLESLGILVVIVGMAGCYVGIHEEY